MGYKNKADHAAYMRRWRKIHPLTDDQRKKDRARSYAGTYKRRGKLISAEQCGCGSELVEMHHPDYDQPLQVEWLCRQCHLTLHQLEMRRGPQS